MGEVAAFIMGSKQMSGSGNCQDLGFHYQNLEIIRILVSIIAAIGRMAEAAGSPLAAATSGSTCTSSWVEPSTAANIYRGAMPYPIT